MLEIRVRGEELLFVISFKVSGLNEVQEGVELLQIVLDGCPRQQEPEVN